MPYSRTLQSYTRPEFYAEPPGAWERRLREISPVLPNTAHLRFRKFDPRPDWGESPFNEQPDRPLWAIYRAVPRALVHPDRAAQFERHWSELISKEDESQGRMTGAAVARKALVSDYQHFMWHTAGLEVSPVWLLQGPMGGTPLCYTPRQVAYLRGVGAETTPLAPGLLTPCVFDERSVAAILKIDRLIQADNNFDALEKMDRSDAKKADDEAAERLYRETYLDTMAALIAPNIEFMKTQRGKAEVNEYLPPAPKGLENTLATWKDVFKETGQMIGVGHATTRKVFATS